MTAQELILLDKGKVRRDSNLMSLYLSYFKEAYNYVPSCAGCSFASDWEKFVSFHTMKQNKSLNLPKEIFMEITIKKIEGKILSYKKDGKTFRIYDNILNDEFIDGYLKNGTDEELTERRKLFIFPVVVIDMKDVDSIYEVDGIQNIVLKDLPKKRVRKSKK